MSTTTATKATAATPATDAGTRPSEPRSLLEEVLAGLEGDRKRLPPKLFYDERGALLFERICELDEYYPTRTELGILRERVGEIAACAGPRTALVEYGSGAGTKVRLLLDALEAPAAYVPIDISGEQLGRVAASMRDDYPEVAIRPVRADYTHEVPLPKLPTGARRVAFFPGSTIGNFHPRDAATFLAGVRATVGSRGALVLGVDRRKDKAVLERAYNDAEGVTAEFNLNLLARLNRELHADFDLESFEHHAFFNEEASRIEMHLVSAGPQTVHVGGRAIDFARGETIWTECSYKYDRVALERLVVSAGFHVRRLWTDARGWFWVAFLDAV
jgi:L-histidine N-alpha-methyltransferase